MANSRMVVKPHRVDKSKMDDNSSNERSSNALKFLSKSMVINDVAAADSDIKHAQRI